MNWGRLVKMPRECDPDVWRAGGVPVVVRERESLLHGEGEQFERDARRLADFREVKTFDNQ